MKQDIVGCKILVLNLARSLDRRKRMMAMLDKLDVPYEFVEATDGNTLSAEDLAKYSEPLALKAEGRPLSKGEIGCALSHLKIYQRLLASEDECYLILEDDVDIGSKLIEIIKRRELFPKDWEFINFMTDNRSIAFGESLLDEYRMTRFPGNVNRCSVNLVNRKGALRLTRIGYPVRLSADGLTGRIHSTGLIAYGVQPNLAVLHDVETTILNRTSPNSSFKWKKRLRHWIKFAKAKLGLA